MNCHRCNTPSEKNWRLKQKNKEYEVFYCAVCKKPFFILLNTTIKRLLKKLKPKTEEKIYDCNGNEIKN